jgi:hypothetical protein
VDARPFRASVPRGAAAALVATGIVVALAAVPIVLAPAGDGEELVDALQPGPLTRRTV